MHTPQTVATVVMRTTNLKELPLNQTFHDLGFSNEQLRKIQIRLTSVFNKTVSTIFFNDTIYTLTERLNETTKH